MNKVLLKELSFFTLLMVSKLSSTFMNVSPFFALIIIASYFIENKYRLLLMVFIAQLISDVVYGIDVSNLGLYLSYYLIILFLFNSEKVFSIMRNCILGLQVNIIFYAVSNLGHYFSFSNEYGVTVLIDTYRHGLMFGIHLVLSTIIFLSVIHALLAVSKLQPACVRSVRK